MGHAIDRSVVGQLTGGGILCLCTMCLKRAGFGGFEDPSSLSNQLPWVRAEVRGVETERNEVGGVEGRQRQWCVVLICGGSGSGV